MSTHLTSLCKPCEPYGYRPYIAFPRQKYIKVTTGAIYKRKSNSFEWNFGHPSSSSNSTEWLVCEQFLAATSSVFQNALKDEWMQSKTFRTLHFEDLDPGVFDIYVRWLERRLLLDSDACPYLFRDSLRDHWEDVDFSGPWINDLEGFDPREDVLSRIRYKSNHNLRIEEELFAVYFFADEFDIPQLRRDVLDTLAKGFDGLGLAFPLNITMVLTVCESLGKKSPMKKWWVDRAARTWDIMSLLSEVANRIFRIQELPQEFLIRVMAQTKRFKDDFPPMDLCDYHGHEVEQGAAVDTFRWMEDM